MGRRDNMGKIMILQFGTHRGTHITQIPESYLFWLCDRGRSTYYKQKHSLDVEWKVPIETWEAARKEAERRGFTKVGERWEKKGGDERHSGYAPGRRIFRKET